ncbi:hypothetical protein QVD17_15721 [Tagetes erecta]|uniref:Uncharacterized protein n=1 Tax=Tagetes erecta TaxID=13708 RepID=A0AAD8NZX7_TARER|nr:hypothetical protein QVD17_15721 [Tagetes erecta]
MTTRFQLHFPTWSATVPATLFFSRLILGSIAFRVRVVEKENIPSTNYSYLLEDLPHLTNFTPNLCTNESGLKLSLTCYTLIWKPKLRSSASTCDNPHTSNAYTNQGLNLAGSKTMPTIEQVLTKQSNEPAERVGGSSLFKKE